MLLIITIIITTSNFIKCCTFAATNRTSNDGADIGDGDDSDKVHWQQVKSITTTMTITTTIATTTATKLAEDAGFEIQAKPFDASEDSQVERARLGNILRIYLYFNFSTLIILIQSSSVSLAINKKLCCSEDHQQVRK